LKARGDDTRAERQRERIARLLAAVRETERFVEPGEAAATATARATAAIARTLGLKTPRER
jgi:hypothetical protein